MSEKLKELDLEIAQTCQEYEAASKQYDIAAETKSAKLRAFQEAINRRRLYLDEENTND